MIIYGGCVFAASMPIEFVKEMDRHKNYKCILYAFGKYVGTYGVLTYKRESYSHTLNRAVAIFKISEIGILGSRQTSIAEPRAFEMRLNIILNDDVIIYTQMRSYVIEREDIIF